MHMLIWRIVPDSDTYRTLTQIESAMDYTELREALKSGRPTGDMWIPLPVRLYDDEEGEEDKPLGDFPSLFAGVPPVFSKRALEVLNPLIADSIEILPLVGLESEFFIVNVIDVVDCLDHQRSKYIKFENSERIMHVEYYVFKENCLKNKHIFIIPEIIRKAVFVSDAFKTLVEQNRLEGLIFKKVA
jgi:hypothetical protein